MASKLTKWIRRRKKICVVLLLVILIAIAPYAISRARSPARRIRILGDRSPAQLEETAEVRVLAYNIAHGRGSTDGNWEESGDAKRQRVHKIARRIRQVDPHIVVLNEVDFQSTWSDHQNQAEAIARAAGFPNWIEQRNLDFRFLYGSWKFGNAVLSKYPIVGANLVDLPAQHRWEDWLAGHKRGVVCTLQISKSQQLRVLAVHLEHRHESVRVASAKVIQDLVAESDVPVIAAGDFNSTPSGFPDSKATADGENAMDRLIDSRVFKHTPTRPPQVDALTYSTDDPTRVIDWILIPPDWYFEDYQVLHWHDSDHRPVVATVRIAD